MAKKILIAVPTSSNFASTSPFASLTNLPTLIMYQVMIALKPEIRLLKIQWPETTTMY